MNVQYIEYKGKRYCAVFEKVSDINYEVKIVCLDDNKTVFLKLHKGYYIALTEYTDIVNHPEKYISSAEKNSETINVSKSDNKYQNVPDGIYVELFAVKDGKRYNYKELSMKELSLTLTGSLMDGIDKICK